MRFPVAALRLAGRISTRLLLLILITGTPRAARAEGAPSNQPDLGDGQWVDFVVRDHKGHAAVYDPVGVRMLVFGGAATTGNAEGVWALDLSGSREWTRLATSGTPPAPRSGHTMVFDPVRYRLIVFGGTRNGSTVDLNDVWALTLAGTPTWTQLAPLGFVPPARHGLVAIYDPVRDQVVIHGGTDGSSTQGSTYALSLGGTPVWSVLPFGAYRSDHSAIYDPIRDRMVIYGGRIGPSDLNDTYALDLSSPTAWVQLALTGFNSPRHSHSAIYDSAGDQMVVFGGIANSTPLNDPWRLNLATLTWSQIPPAGQVPNARSDHSAIYDAVSDRMIVYGGGATSHAYSFPFWAPAWSTYGDGSAFPVERSFHSAIFDPVTSHMIVFFGDTGYNQYIPLGDAWRLSLGSTPSWTQLSSPLGYAVGAGTVAVLDPARHQAIVTLAASNRLQLEGSPSWYPQILPGYLAADQRSSIYDPVRDRVIVFGGHRSSGFIDEVYAVSLSGTPAWTPLGVVGSPGARGGHIAVYDPARDRMIVFGGVDGNGARSDLWALSLSGAPTWTPLSPAGPVPSGRSLASAYYDSRRDRIVMYGGYTYTYNRELWALSLAGAPTWQLLQPTGTYPSERKGQTLVYDPVQDRAILFGGEYYGLNLVRYRDCLALEGDGPIAGPDVRVYPQSEALGIVGGPTSWNLVIRNDGSSSLHVAAISISEPSITAAGTTTFDLASGEMRQVRLTWAPASNGPMSATITVTSDDPDSPSKVVPVTGATSPVPRFTLSEDSLHVTLHAYETADVPILVSSVGDGEYQFDAWVLGPEDGVRAERPREDESARGEAAPVRPSPLEAGGPDAFGYLYDDDHEPGGPSTLDWVDLSGTLPVGPTGNDELSDELPIGFEFPFYGESFTTLRACTNGWLSFSNGTLTTAANTSLPRAGVSLPENLLAVFWDDLDFLGAQRIHVQSTPTRMVVEFDDVASVEGPYRTNTFQVQLFPDGTILYLYIAMNAIDLASCTIGIQNGARDDGLLVAFNEDYLGGYTYPNGASAIRFRPPPTYVSVSPRSGSVQPGDALDLVVHFDSSGLPWGEYAGTVRMRGNDPFEPGRDIPVRLTVAPPLDVPGGPVVERLGLSFAGPNPARDGAALELAMPARAWAEVDVYDVRGRLVNRLARHELESGRHLIRWDGTDGGGNAAGAGIYFVRARAGGEKTDLRIALLR